MKKPSKFLLSGVVNTTLSYLAFLAVFTSTKSAAAALFSGLVVGMFNSYLLNRYWIWKVQERGSVPRFIMIQIGLLLINWILLHLISLTQFPREIAQIIIYAFLAPLTYKLNESYVFGKKL